MRSSYLIYIIAVMLQFVFVTSYTIPEIQDPIPDCINLNECDVN